MNTSAGINDVLQKLWSLYNQQDAASTGRKPSFSVEVSEKVPAGRGLAFKRQISPGQTLLTLSKDLLINVKTFRACFDPAVLPLPRSLTGASIEVSRTVLSSSQALAVLLSRFSIESHSQLINHDDIRAETLRLFVSTLPSSFETLPLHWLEQTQKDIGATKQLFYTNLTQALPRHSQKLLRKVQQRFENDWSKVRTLQSTDPDKLADPRLLSTNAAQSRKITQALNRSNFLWAWSCVNTRCVFLPLQLANYADNFTLVPILDMANHTSDGALECKVRYEPDGALTLTAPEAQNRPTEVLGQGLGAGDECYITYGPHSNESLLSEYGFVLPPKVDSVRSADNLSPWRGNRYADVLVDEEVESMLNEQGTDGERKIELLQDRGYWGDFSLHPCPEQPHPSHRLVPALRLLPLRMPRLTTDSLHAGDQTKGRRTARAQSSAKAVIDHAQSDLDKWEATLTGYEDCVSAENEKQAHLALISLCQRKMQAAQMSFQHLSAARHSFETDLSRTLTQEALKSCDASLSIVEQLLEEENSILELVKLAAERQTEW